MKTSPPLAKRPRLAPTVVTLTPTDFRPSGWSRLPTELKQNVLYRLSDADLLRVSTVDRTTRALVMDDLVLPPQQHRLERNYAALCAQPRPSSAYLPTRLAYFLAHADVLRMREQPLFTQMCLSWPQLDMHLVQPGLCMITRAQMLQLDRLPGDLAKKLSVSIPASAIDWVLANTQHLKVLTDSRPGRRDGFDERLRQLTSLGHSGRLDTVQLWHTSLASLGQNFRVDHLATYRLYLGRQPLTGLFPQGLRTLQLRGTFFGGMGAYSFTKLCESLPSSVQDLALYEGAGQNRQRPQLRLTQQVRFPANLQILRFHGLSFVMTGSKVALPKTLSRLDLFECTLQFEPEYLDLPAHIGRLTDIGNWWPRRRGSQADQAVWPLACRVGALHLDAERVLAYPAAKAGPLLPARLSVHVRASAAAMFDSALLAPMLRPAQTAGVAAAQSWRSYGCTVRHLRSSPVPSGIATLSVELHPTTWFAVPCTLPLSGELLRSGGLR